VALEIRLQEPEVEPAQTVLVLDHDNIDLVGVHQLEQPVEFWPRVRHARTYFFKCANEFVSLTGDMGDDAIRLAFEITLLFLVVTADPAIGNRPNLLVFTLGGFSTLELLDVGEPVLPPPSGRPDGFQGAVSVPTAEGTDVDAEKLSGLSWTQEPVLGGVLGF